MPPPVHRAPADGQRRRRSRSARSTGRPSSAPRGLAVAGGVVTVLGIVFFFALAVNRGWIGPGARVLLGTAASTIFFVAGIELRRRYGRLHAPVAAVGPGLAGGYATLLAATALYDLVPKSAALIFAAAIAAAGVAVSLAWREQLVAAIGLLGAIAAPALLAIDGSLTATGTAFVAFMVAAAAAVSVSLRWRALLVAAAVAGTPQALLLFGDRQRPDAELLVLAAAFCGIYLAAGIARQLRAASSRIDATASTFIVGSAGLAFLFALELFSRSDRLYRGVDLLAYGVAYAAVGTYVYARKNGRDLGAIVIALALALGAVGVADVLSGGGLTYAWAAEAAALAWIARRLREPRFALAALAYLLLGLTHALAVDAPPTQLMELSAHPAAGAMSLIAVALASAAFAIWAVEWTELPKWAAFLGNRRVLQVGASALAAVLVADAAALAVLEVYVRVWPGGVTTAFEHGHVAVTGLWALAAAVAVTLGLPRRSAAVAAGGLVWSCVVLAKTTLFDAGSIAPTLSSYAFLEVAGALLLVAALIQLRRRGLWPDPTVAYGTVAVSLLLTLRALSTLLDGRFQGAASLGVAALYACLAAFFLERGERAFATVLWTLGAMVAAVAEAQLVDGQWLVAVWSASAVAFAALVAVASERRFQFAAAVYLLLAFALTLVEQATPADLLSASRHPAHGLFALTALTLATFVAARLCRPPQAPARDAVDSSLDALQPRLRSSGSWLAAAFALYGVSLCILQIAEWIGPRDVMTNFQSGHTAVSALWGALGLTLLYVGLRRSSGALRVGGLALFGISLAKLFLYDLSRLSSITRALSFLAVGAVLLLGGFFYQRLGARAENGTAASA